MTVQQLSMEQAIVISAFTGFSMCPWDFVHDEIERRLGHKVEPHQLRGLHQTEIVPAFQEDYYGMMPIKPPAPLIEQLEARGPLVVDDPAGDATIDTSNETTDDDTPGQD